MTASSPAADAYSNGPLTNIRPTHAFPRCARPHDRPPRSSLTLLPGDERPTTVDPATVGDFTGRWIARLSSPTAELLGAGDRQILVDVATGSQAYTASDSFGGWTVTQRGPVRLWDQVEEALGLWQAAGSPHQSEFGITITPTSQRVHLGGEDGGMIWRLPI